MDDVYRNPGPLQFDGPGTDTKAVSLCVEDQDYMGRIKQLQVYLEKVKGSNIFEGEVNLPPTYFLLLLLQIFILYIFLL